jgi:hypothetical protein
MIALSPSACVYLASGITDMRNYAECIDLGDQDGGACKYQSVSVMRAWPR